MGKTTVALALGLAAARRGLRTIVCEVAHQERFSRLMGREGVGYEETEIADNLNAISLDQQHTLEEWVTYQLPSKTLAEPALPQRDLPAPDLRRARHQGARHDREDLGARPAPPQDEGRAPVRLRRRGLAGHRPRPGHAARAAHVRRHRARRPDPPPGRPDPRLHRLRQDRRARGRAAGGDAGQRDARVLANEIEAFRGALDARRRERALSGAVHRGGGRFAERPRRAGRSRRGDRVPPLSIAGGGAREVEGRGRGCAPCLTALPVRARARSGRRSSQLSHELEEQLA